ncbi:MAG TPA: hypothetical protein VM118_15410 [Acidobacteriota bacterium]|nr:hypothetical protein [Acidobacteriota bacterium]
MVRIVFEGMENQIEAIRKQIGQITAATPNKMIRSDLGQASFVTARPYFESWHALLSELETLPWAGLPPSELSRLSKTLSRIEAAYSLVGHFSLSAPDKEAEKDPIKRRNRDLDQVRAQFENTYAELMQLLTFLRPSRYDDSDMADVYRDDMERLRRAATEYVEALKSQAAEGAVAVDDLKRTAGVGGASKHAGLFKSEAEENRKWARFWLFAAGAFAVLCMCFVWWWFVRPGPVTPSADIVADWNLFAAKLLLISLLVSAAVWATRNYSAHRHNYVINQHRHNALESFETFATSASEGGTRDAVLLQATRCIFEHQTSGYLGRAGGAQAKTLISEVVERAVPRRVSEPSAQ